MRDDDNISFKTNKVLNLFLLALILIFIRVWFLSVIQYEDQRILSQKPRRRVNVEKIERGTIRDRFNTPLAENKIQYAAAICYADIKEIPSYTFEYNEKGERKKIFKRKEHIAKLSQLLAKELTLDSQDIEDIIYGKAALFPQVPFIIKEDLSEKEYFRLRSHEKDWTGIRSLRNTTRVYPYGKTACDIIGYMGSISDKEYKALASQIAELEHYIEQREMGETPVLPKGFEDPLQVRSHLQYLKERVYTLQDFIGKSGIEARYDKELRGVYGKHYVEVDTKGNILRQLPGSKEASPAKRIVLSISSELQAFAEKLLAEREKDRDATTKIKGGAIIAMDPHTGELLALASYPRFSPEDFIPAANSDEKQIKTKAVSKWLENEPYLGQIWDGERPLEKEVFDANNGYYCLNETLSWQTFLQKILSPKSSIFHAMQKIKTIRDAWILQDAFSKLQELTNFKDPKDIIYQLYPTPHNATASWPEANTEEWNAIREDLDPLLSTIATHTDKLLSIDLCRLLVPKEKISAEFLEEYGHYSLDEYNMARQSVACLKKALEKEARQFFHQTLFQKWRDEHFKSFLKEKRAIEADQGLYAKPYTEYLELEEKRQFKELWQKQKNHLLQALLFPEKKIETLFAALLSQHLKDKNWNVDLIQKTAQFFETLTLEAKSSYLKSMRSFSELTRPLLGKYRLVRSTSYRQLEKHLAEAFYPLSGYGYVRSTAFRQATPQGSVFKLVVAYEALKERYHALKEKYQYIHDLNPLTLIDQIQWSADKQAKILGSLMDGKPITRVYKGGKLPRSHASNIGKIDLIGAIEQSSNIYFSLLASEYIDSPSSLLETSRAFNFGNKTAIDLPGEIEGKLPEDINYNKTGLYAFAIGQHSLVVTPLQTAVMLSAIANGGFVLKPQVIRLIASKEKSEHNSPFDFEEDYPFEKQLSLIGIHFPLFTETLPKHKQNYLQAVSSEIKNSLFLPEEIRHVLLEGMQQVIMGKRGTARPSPSLRALCHSEKIFRDYVDLQTQLVGKTGTAEILVKPSIDTESKAQMQNHVWFAGIAFENAQGNEEKWDNPELVVVVYLREGSLGGKEGAPLAAQIVKKWREIKQKH